MKDLSKDFKIRKVNFENKFLERAVVKATDFRFLGLAFKTSGPVLNILIR